MELISPSIARQISVGLENHNMRESGEILSSTETPDGSGGTTTTWGTTTSNVPVRVSPVSRGMTEQIQAMGYSPMEVLILELPLGTVISEANRFSIGARLFEVIGVLGDYTYDAVLQVVVVER